MGLINHKYDTWFYEDSIIHKISKEDVTVYSESDLVSDAKKYDLWFGKWRKE